MNIIEQETADMPLRVIRQLTSESSSNIIRIPTGGTVSILYAYNISLMQPTHVHACTIAIDNCSCHKGQISRESNT